jgi:hypothetical protein
MVDPFKLEALRVQVETPEPPRLFGKELWSELDSAQRPIPSSESGFSFQ